MKVSILLSASLILVSATGCTTMRGMTSDPTIVQASADSITYRAAEGLRDEARKGAETHCEKQSKRAELEGVVPGNNSERSFTYRCV
jgi:predicted small secreted protein